MVLWRPRHVLGWCRAVGPSSRSPISTITTEDVRLGPGLLLLQSRSACFDESTLDVACNVGREDWACVQGAWGRLLPCVEHLIQLPPSVSINQSINIHKCLVHVPAKEEGVGASDVLNDGIGYIEGWKLLQRWCLHIG